MEAVIERKQTAFRLATDLIERLKVLAKKENRVCKINCVTQYFSV